MEIVNLYTLKIIEASKLNRQLDNSLLTENLELLLLKLRQKQNIDSYIDSLYGSICELIVYYKTYYSQTPKKTIQAIVKVLKLPNVILDSNLIISILYIGHCLCDSEHIQIEIEHIVGTLEQKQLH